MRFRGITILILATAGCGGSDNSGGAPAEDSAAVAAPSSVTQPPPLDSLIAALDSAGGTYVKLSAADQLGLNSARINYDHFRGHSHDGVKRLIDCLTDRTTTTTTHYDSEEYRYPRGMLCFEVLEYLTDVDASRELPINTSDLYIDRRASNVGDELRRAQKAWRVVYEARAYRFRSR